jgi:tetratricopeptide (TPR) repeat protein
LEGKAQNAMDDFDRALEANPDNVDAMYHKATLLIGRKEYDRSMEIFNKAIALYPSSTYIYNNRGALKFASGDLYGAMLDYKKAHELDPKNRLASLNYHGLFAIPDRIGLSGTATVGDAKGTLTAEASWPLFYAGKKLRLGPALGIEYSAPKDLGIMGGFAFRYLNRVLLLGIDASVGYNGGGLARYSLDILFRADDFAVGPTAVFSHMFKDVKEFDTALGLVIQYNIW